ncbi:enoyl-CoA hydratase/isomerase family protein [Iodobacter fluviatilis]|uniref:enoyl-CoA hydratase/isomerase family protein n=1 Tax=Iodobacter fluviatilis TaxID=537 RepID=UPI001CAA86C0|nr:enoyl-CoA hydratase/isomerase family protein [Iodobacter fluviatilis]
MVLGDNVKNIPEISIEFDYPLDGKSYRDIWYEESNQVGYLYFDFYNGAMSTHQCNRLLKLFKETKEKNTKVIVLMGGEFWSNGINLNTIEASNNAAKESWDNINAMNDLILEILTTESHLIISAMQGNSGAGGVILGLAADIVYARTGVIMNPHYKSMGNLYGSEYWTYLLPKRVGFVKATELTEQCLPIGSNDAQVIGLLDGAFGNSLDSFKNEVKKRAEMFIYNHELSFILAEKSLSFNEEKSQNNLKKHRAEELRKMWENFYGEDSRYHEARNKFVYKIASVA